MEQYTIQPLRKLLDSGKDTFNQNDLAQVRAKVINTRKRKEASPKHSERFSVFFERKYLEILKTLIARVGSGKITRAELIAQTDEILRAANYFYIKQVHQPAHDNFFLPDAELHPPPRAQNRNNQAVTTYDLAFYNPLSRKNRAENHHEFKDPAQPRQKPLKSVWYLRAEEYPDERRILFGNMQIDDYDRFGWKKLAVGKILLAPKTINLTMLQSAVQHALAKGKTDIIFQGGDAAVYAQGLDRPGKPTSVLITKQNFAKYQKIYEAQLKKFAAVQVGDLKEQRRVVFGKTETEYKMTNRYNYSFGLMNFLHDYSFDNEDERIKKKIVQLFECYCQEPTNIKRQVRMINKIFNTPKIFTPEKLIEDNPAQHAQKEKFLAQLLAPEKGQRWAQRDYLEALEPFLEKFDYKKKMEKFGFAPLIGLAHTAKRPGALYVHTQYDYIDTVNRHAYLQAPRLGQRHFLFDYDKPWPELKHQISIFRVWDYYENRVPQQLRKLKLTVEPQTLLSTRGTRTKITKKHRATGWKIIAGLEEFAVRPLLSFANAPEIVMTPVALPELHAAARKFGLTAEQVHVAHELFFSAGRHSPAVYNAGTDQLHLTGAQLEFLAHEGLHRLRAQHAIPAREYEALVHAGRRLVMHRPDLQKRVTAATSAGTPEYPAGPVRDEEYAALWVENLYTTNSRARKHLTGSKLTTLEKIIDYVQAVLEIIGVYVQNDAALARAFLRKIERETAALPERPARGTAQAWGLSHT